MIAIVCLALLAETILSSTLSVVDFTSYSTSSQYSVSRNAVGLSYDFPTIQPYFGNQLFQEYMINSNLYGDWSANFVQSIHNPPGYMYNCSKQASFSPNVTYNCSFDLDNDTLLQQIGDFFYATCMYWGSSLAWDMELANFSNTYYIS